jgi:hypothetical protein
MRDMTEKIVTPDDGSFDSTLRVDDTLAILLGGPHRSALPRPVPERQREQRVAAANLDDAPVVVGLGDLAPHESVAEPPQLVAIEVVDELVNLFGRRLRRWPEAVPPELLEDLWTVVIRHNGVADYCPHPPM